MTVSNSKTLSEILRPLHSDDCQSVRFIPLADVQLACDCYVKEALHAIATLIEGAKPTKRGLDGNDSYKHGYEMGVKRYEQNLKELL